MFDTQDACRILILHGVKEINFLKGSVIYDVMFCRGFGLPCTAGWDSCTDNRSPCEEIWTIRFLFIFTSFCLYPEWHVEVLCRLQNTYIFMRYPDRFVPNAELGLISVPSEKVSHSRWLRGLGDAGKFIPLSVWREAFWRMCSCLRDRIRSALKAHLKSQLAFLSFCTVFYAPSTLPSWSSCFSGVFQPLYLSLSETPPTLF